jgi:hypothetical protein
MPPTIQIKGVVYDCRQIRYYVTKKDSAKTVR